MIFVAKELKFHKLRDCTHARRRVRWNRRSISGIVAVMYLKQRAMRVNELLGPLYRDLKPLINYRSCYELTIAVILSAQTTDNQVNSVTPELFARFPGPAELGAAEPETVEDIIRPVGFYKVKANHIRRAARMIDREYSGKIPGTMEKLLVLPGVGRKSANVILGFCFDRPAIITDTHFMRVVLRTGLIDSGSPSVIEHRIGELLPRKEWTAFSMRVNRHGRTVCTARSPECGKCPLTGICDYYQSELKKQSGSVSTAVMKRLISF